MLVVLATIIFLVLERAIPGRELPKVKGWYWRALLVNLVQLGITLATARFWIQLFGISVFKLSAWNMPLAEGFVGWFVGTFFFYWWHVLRHKNGFWLVFHQVHHSPSRIEIATSFYKHPLEILSDAILSALVLYPLLGCSMMGAFWYNFLAATGEYFYHANIKTRALTNRELQCRRRSNKTHTRPLPETSSGFLSSLAPMPAPAGRAGKLV
jgi:sterol desaturase/sphingolipid hydroxylase (fatty acid hydroxylase superfamily)